MKRHSCATRIIDIKDSRVTCEVLKNKMASQMNGYFINAYIRIGIDGIGKGHYNCR